MDPITGLIAAPMALIDGKYLSTAVWVVIAIAWILLRLMQPHRVSLLGLLILPVILGYFGLDNLTHPHTTAAVVIFGLGIVVELGIGAWIGTTFRMWRSDEGSSMAQGTKLTLWIWGLAFAVRIVMIVIEKAIDGGISDVSGFLVTLAAAFIGMNIVVGSRAGVFKAPDVPSGPRADPPSGSTTL
jgi:hypothetical protein